MNDAYYRFEEFEIVPYEELTPQQVTEARLTVVDDRRQEDGLVVALLWNSLEETLQIHGVHEITKAEFTFPVQPDKAHEALEDPISYAVGAGLATEGIYSVIREAA